MPNIPLKPSQDILDFIVSTVYYKEGHLYRRYTDSPIGSDNGYGYLQIKLKNKTMKAHHVVWFLCKGVWPSRQLDHKDRIRTNNLIDNLQESTDHKQQENISRIRKLPIGVVRNGYGYGARLQLNKKKIWLGTFPTLNEAILARKTAVELYLNV